MGDEIKRVHNTAFDKYVTKQLEDPEFARGTCKRWRLWSAYGRCKTRRCARRR